MHVDLKNISEKYHFEDRGGISTTGCCAVGSASGLGPGGRTFESCHPDMKKHILVIFLFFSVSAWTLAAPKSGHYVNLDGKSGKTLFDQVSTIANKGFESLGYDGLWDAYKYTDTDENGYIIDMYGGCNFQFGKKKCGSYKNECDCYNREHSIPKSWFGGKTSGMGCDIFHIVPTDGKVNGMRSNYPFGEVANHKSATYSYNGNYLGSSSTEFGKSMTVFEPKDEYKGDFARGYMGAMIKWQHSNMKQSQGGEMFTSNYTSTGGYGFTQYSIKLLMKWHREDPVSDKERKRNDGIEKTQGNRNPFIDYPYLAEYFWGEKKDQKLDFDHLVCAYDDDFELYPNGWKDEDPSDIDYIYAQPADEPCFDCGNKVIIDGNIYIRQGEHLYNIMGVVVK